MFSFNEVIILEDGIRGVVGFSLGVGFIVSFIWSFRFLGRKFLGNIESKVKSIEKDMRSFFLCIFYTAYLVPLFNICGLGLAKVALEDVDIG